MVLIVQVSYTSDYFCLKFDIDVVLIVLVSYTSDHFCLKFDIDMVLILVVCLYFAQDHTMINKLVVWYKCTAVISWVRSGFVHSCCQ
jgi:hypothetical protein